MGDKLITDDYGNSVERRVPHSKVAYDPRISLNTIVVCGTLIGGLLAFTDRLSSHASTQAVQQSQLNSLKQEITALNSQRFIDRQEILSELREMRQDIKALHPNRK